MNGRIPCEFWVEGATDRSSIAHEHRIPVQSPENLDARTDLDDARRPDEDPGNRAVLLQFDRGFETLVLPAVGVTSGLDIEHPEPALISPSIANPSRKQDQAGAGAEHRQTAIEKFSDRLTQSRSVEEHRHRGRLSSGKDQTIDILQVDRKANSATFDAERGEEGQMVRERALKGEHSDRQLRKGRAHRLTSRGRNNAR